MTELAPEMTFEEDRLRNIGPATIRPRRELARRVSGGIEVTLYWSPHDNSTSIEVWQSAIERSCIAPSRETQRSTHSTTPLPISGPTSRPAQARCASRATAYCSFR